MWLEKKKGHFGVENLERKKTWTFWIALETRNEYEIEIKYDVVYILEKDTNLLESTEARAQQQVAHSDYA